jgi:CDP-diacylglycerol---serine O-phosphatidyltransferase
MVRSYTIADLSTLGNASCGTISIFLCLNYVAEGRNKFFWIAFVLLFIVLACDIMDGYWARPSRRQSVLGADLDSLADIVSFGVVCGISRLARFNVTAEALSDSSGKVKYFEGTPIPTSILIVVILGVAFSQHAIESATWFGAYPLGLATLHPLTLLYAGSGAGMISATIRADAQNLMGLFGEA